MDKKLTTAAGLALGVSLVAGAGFALYKYFTKKKGNAKANGANPGPSVGIGRVSDFIGNSLVKGNSLYKDIAGNGLVGGGLYKAVAS